VEQQHRNRQHETGGKVQGPTTGQAYGGLQDAVPGTVQRDEGQDEREASRGTSTTERGPGRRGTVGRRDGRANAPAPKGAEVAFGGGAVGQPARANGGLAGGREGREEPTTEAENQGREGRRAEEDDGRLQARPQGHARRAQGTVEAAAPCGIENHTGGPAAAA